MHSVTMPRLRPSRGASHGLFGRSFRDTVADFANAEVRPRVADMEREARIDPARLEAAELPTRAPDPADWVGVIGSWLGPPDPAFPVVVGESGDGATVDDGGQAVAPAEAAGGEDP